MLGLEALADEDDADEIEQVEVTNFPDPQNVTGSVEVTNDATNPADVSGEVAGRGAFEP